MPSLHTPANAGKTFSFLQRFGMILRSFTLLFAVSLPFVLSFDFWVLKDKSSAFNLDFLFRKHYLLGVDVYYSYGLLPVLLEHLAFDLFGHSYHPLLGVTILSMGLFALFWALLLDHLPKQKIWLFAVIALSPITLLINSTLPYTIVTLSMLFALLMVLKKRLDLALVVAVVGCYSVPSLPIVLSALLTVCIFFEWWTSSERKLEKLFGQLAPGVLVYIGLGIVLGVVFGFKSLFATALPINGAKYYHAAGLGTIEGFSQFIYPRGYDLKYYLAYYLISPVTWFVLSTLLLAVFAYQAIVRLYRERQLNWRSNTVLLCCIVHIVFILFAYGFRAQHTIYDSVLATGTLLGISLLSSTQIRNLVLLVFLGVGVLGEGGQVYKTAVAWRTTRPGPDTAGLYADPQFMTEWSVILKTSKSHKVLMMSYGTGVHLYYPTVESPEVWFLLPNLLFPSDMQRILDQMQQADFIVEDLTSSSAFVDYDPDVQARLATMHEVSSTQNFRIWARDTKGLTPTE